jgi:hypothetical protein
MEPERDYMLNNLNCIPIFHFVKALRQRVRERLSIKCKLTVLLGYLKNLAPRVQIFNRRLQSAHLARTLEREGNREVRPCFRLAGLALAREGRIATARRVRRKDT